SIVNHWKKKEFEKSSESGIRNSSKGKEKSNKKFTIKKTFKKRALKLYNYIRHYDKYRITFNKIVEYIMINLKLPIDRFMLNKERLKYFIDISFDFNKYFHEFVEKTVAISKVSKTIQFVINKKINEMNVDDIKKHKSATNLKKKQSTYPTLSWHIVDHLKEWVESKPLLKINNKTEKFTIKEINYQKAFDKQIKIKFSRCNSINKFKQINNKKENKIPVTIDFREPIALCVLKVKLFKNCNNGTKEIFEIQVLQMMSCRKEYQWLLELKCERNQDEFNVVKRTMNPYKKAHRDGYLFEYLISHRCIHFSIENWSEIEYKKKNQKIKNQDGFWKIILLEILYNAKEILTINIILSFTIIFILIKCIMKGRKWKNKKEFNEIMLRLNIFYQKISKKDISNVHWFFSLTKTIEGFNGHIIYAVGNCIAKFLLNSKVVPISVRYIKCLDKFDIPVAFRVNSNIIQMKNIRNSIISLSGISLSISI
uniref:Uncharacterized protein n=1 Tax=Strongyloides stercoralis TaxID=6248 RepID=A0AAF5DJI7_STRER